MWFYSLMIERDLFGSVSLVRNWGKVGTKGREIADKYPLELSAGQALQPIAEKLRRQGYSEL
jgi:predicted DNA-binding WGR domain protein